jgi:opacity protein-like surface antigen
MKKTVLAVVPMACLLSAPTFAQDIQPSVSTGSFEGVYVGAEGGILNSFANVDSSTSANYLTTYSYSNFSSPVPKIMSNKQKSKLNSNFGAGALSIGYGKLLNNVFYVGGELSVDLSNRKNSMTTTEYNATSGFVLADTGTLKTTTNAKLNFAELDIDFKPGITLFANTLAYGRIGVAFNKLTVDSISNLAIQDNVLDPFLSNSNNTLSASNSKNITGLRLGFGAEHFVTPKLAAKFDYIYTWYGTVNVNGVGGVVNTFDGLTNPTGFSNYTSAKLSTQSVMAGLTYHFNDGVYQK